MHIAKVGLVTIVSTGILACQPRPVEEMQRPATDAPPFQAQVDSVPRDSVVAYGRRLTFDTSHAASDAQHLVLRQGGRLVVGPYARIAPEARMARLVRGDLARGRIVARIESDGPYAPRGIPAGVSYLWVDSAAGGWRSIIVPEDGAQPMAVKPLHFTGHGRTEAVAEPPAQARWTWWPESGAMGECYMCPPPDFWCVIHTSDALRLIR